MKEKKTDLGELTEEFKERMAQEYTPHNERVSLEQAFKKYLELDDEEEEPEPVTPEEVRELEEELEDVIAGRKDDWDNWI